VCEERVDCGKARQLFPDETDFLVLSLGAGELTRPIHSAEAKD
jgi:hypothetical protein